jgi:hypothetical protein
MQMYRFGKPTKVAKTPGQLRMKIWPQGAYDAAWVAKIDAKTSAIISMKRDTMTDTIGENIKPGSSTVAPATTSKTKKSANPMASWPQTIPTCADAG